MKVEFRSTGNSMVPLIRSLQLVTVAPVDPAAVEVVAGTTCLHLVSAGQAPLDGVIARNRYRRK